MRGEWERDWRGVGGGWERDGNEEWVMDEK